nr:MFS transporter [Candidatus Sigynarchaeota archaeon]
MSNEIKPGALPTTKARPGTPPATTPDFGAMVSNVRWCSVGFFFTEFLIPYVASEKLGASGINIGFLFSFLILGSSVSAIIVGILADRKSKTTLVLIGAFGRGSSYVIIFTAILVRSLLLLNIATTVLGLLVAFYWVPFDALVGAKSNKNNRSHAFGRRHAAVGQGILVGGVIGTSIFIFSLNVFPGNDALAFSPLLIYFSSNMIGGILFWKRVDEHLTYNDYMKQQGYKVNAIAGVLDSPGTNNGAGNGTNQPTGFMRALRSLPAGFSIGFSLLIASFFLSNVNGTMAKPFIQVYMLNVFTDDPVLVLLAYIPVGIVSMLMAPKMGKLVDRLDPAVGVTIFGILGAIQTIVLVNVTDLLTFAFVLVSDAALANGGQLLLQNIFSRVSVRNRGTVIGTGQAFGNAGGAVGPIIGGLAWDGYGPRMPFVISIFVELSLIIPYLLALKRIRPYIAESFSKDAGLQATGADLSTELP